MTDHRQSLLDIIAGKRHPEGLGENLAAAGLQALSLPYCLAMRLRAGLWTHSVSPAHRFPVPVISVGNLTAGGTGKTPMILYLAGFLRSLGKTVVIISRGYGGTAVRTGGIVSDGSNIHLSPEEAGDEPWMLARRLKTVPVLVGRDRVKSGRLACERFSPDVLLLDDGYQHLRVRRDINLLLMDAAAPLGNGHMLPRGLLREPVSAMQRADALILTRAETSPSLPPVVRAFSDRLPVFSSIHRINRQDPSIQGRPVLAFSGIGDNEAFFRTVGDTGAHLQLSRSFPDHHPYSDADIAALIADARTAGVAALVTTEKDKARLHSDGARALNTFRNAGLSVQDLRIDLEMKPKESKNGPTDFEAFLQDRLAQAENKI